MPTFEELMNAPTFWAEVVIQGPHHNGLWRITMTDREGRTMTGDLCRHTVDGYATEMRKWLDSLPPIEPPKPSAN